MPNRPILSPERQEQIDNLNTAIAEATALVRTLSDQRTRIFRQLRDEGWKLRWLADLAGITPQRMSKILNPEVTPRGGGMERRQQRDRRKAQPWDGWV